MATSFTPAPLVTGVQLTGGITTLYTVPVLTTVEITALTVTNTDSLPHAVSVYIAATSALAGAAQCIWSGTLAGGQSYSVYQAINQSLGAGSTIQAQADLNSVVSLRASGIIIT